MSTPKFTMAAVWRAILRPLANIVKSGIRLVDGDFWADWVGSSNHAGKQVTVVTALQTSAGWSCVRLIAETGSTLPVGIYRELPDGTKVLDKMNNLYYLLHTQPNADMTAATFWQVVLSSLLLWGNSYVEKRYSGRTVTSLDFLRPQYVTRRLLPNGAVEWRYEDPVTRASRVIPESRMWHIPAFTLDGVCGLSPISMGAQVFGSAIAAEQAAAETFTNGMKSPGVVKMNSFLQAKQREEVRAHVKEVTAKGGVMVLENSTGFDAIAMNPQDAELLSTRAFGVEEVCRWFRVPPFMVGHSEKLTSWGTGIEQQMIGFVTFVLRPWCVRIEQSIRKDLIPPELRGTVSAEFSIEGLLRGDSAARAAFYQAMVNNGVMTRDECRKLENLAAKGGNADVLTVQTAMAPIDSLGQQTDASNARNALLAFLNAGEPAKE